MSIEAEIISLVKAVPSFYSPIGSSFSPQKTLTDLPVQQRLAYNQVQQDIIQSPIPYLVWEGPFNTDLGQVSKGFSGTWKSDFWFNCYHQTLTQAGQWADDIWSGIRDYFLANIFCNLTTFRIISAIYLDRYPITIDQKIKTGQEFPISQFKIGYKFGYQTRFN